MAETNAGVFGETSGFAPISPARLLTAPNRMAFVRQTKPSADPLEPAWGEPELLMNLAWSYLNRTKPDLDAAERYADQSLKLVPNWHYVRDILLPQIARAKASP